MQQTIPVDSSPFSQAIATAKERVEWLYVHTPNNAAVESDFSLCDAYRIVFCRPEGRDISYSEVATIKRWGRWFRNQSQTKGSVYFGRFIRSLSKQEADAQHKEVCKWMWKR